MSKTKIVGILIAVVAILHGVVSYLQGQPVDFNAILQEVLAGAGLVFLRSGVDTAVAKALQK